MMLDMRSFIKKSINMKVQRLKNLQNQDVNNLLYHHLDNPWDNVSKLTQSSAAYQFQC